jgi:hypothetical protein
VEGFALGSYLQLVDYTAGLYRAGKASVSREVAAILDRLGSTALEWQARLEKLRQGRFLQHGLSVFSLSCLSCRVISGDMHARARADPPAPGARLTGRGFSISPPLTKEGRGGPRPPWPSR